MTTFQYLTIRYWLEGLIDLNKRIILDANLAEVTKTNFMFVARRKRMQHMLSVLEELRLGLESDYAASGGCRDTADALAKAAQEKGDWSLEQLQYAQYIVAPRRMQERDWDTPLYE